MAEGLEGGFSAIYPMLRALEEAGRIRRGYFVAGLGAAQFALAGALERLRSVREPAADRPAMRPLVHLLAAADPANPYGAAVPWPRRGETDKRPLQRLPGRPSSSSTGSRRCTWTAAAARSRRCRAFDDPAVAAAALGALRGLLADGSRRELVIEPRRRRARRSVAVVRNPCSNRVSSRAIAGSSCGKIASRR